MVNYRFHHSVAFRLAVVCGALVIGAVALFSVVFYFGTIGAQIRTVDGKLARIADRLSDFAQSHPLDALAGRIRLSLADDVDVDTEIYYLADAEGRPLAGNIAGAVSAAQNPEGIVERQVQRNGRSSPARLLVRHLEGGALLVVGRDMSDINRIKTQVWRSIGIGSVLALTLAVFGSLFLRRLIERRLLAIRHTAAQIEAGDLHQRIPLPDADDEFTRLSRDINRMLDRIAHLMDGVRHVSNTIAHNLRTPLGCIRGNLEAALRTGAGADALAAVGHTAIGQIDELIGVLEKLLQIAEAQSGTRRQPFAPVPLEGVVTDIVELYDAAAEAQGIVLTSEVERGATVLGDRSLIGGLLSNLLDNALKYAGAGAHVAVTVAVQPDGIALAVSDDGPGIPSGERMRVLERFYRASHNVPGSGLGLPIVAAIASLHAAALHLEDAAPGLRVRIVFPLADA